MLDWEAFRELTCCPFTKTCTLGERPELDGAGAAGVTTEGLVDDVLAGGVLVVVVVLADGVLAVVVVLVVVVVLAGGVLLAGTYETGVAVTVLVSPGLVCKAGMETVTGAEGVVTGLEVAAGIRAAALGISSLPIVRPVTGS